MVGYVGCFIHALCQCWCSCCRAIRSVGEKAVGVRLGNNKRDAKQYLVNLGSD